MAQANTKAIAQACSYCHERKIKCVLGTNDAGCQACERNIVVCRLRHPKKVGRPHGAPHYSFAIRNPEQNQSAGYLPSKPPSQQRRQNPMAQTPPETVATSYSTEPRSQSPYVGVSVDDAAHISFAAFTPPIAELQPEETLPKAFSHSNTNYRNSFSRQTITSFSQSTSSLDLHEKITLQDEPPYLSDEDVSPLFTETMDFADLFPHTPSDDGLPVDDSSSTFICFFNLYLETHKALTEIRSGIQEVSIADLKDGHGVMRTIISINELGNTMARVHSSTLSPCLAFAFVVVVQGCELAEQILTTILPSSRPPTRSNSAESLAMDYNWTTCTPMFNGHPKLSVEHITALVRLDIHLSQFNNFVSTFTQIQMAHEQGSPAQMLAMQCRKRLLHFHTQIRSVVDSMIPAWD